MSDFQYRYLPNEVSFPGYASDTFGFCSLHPSSKKTLGTHDCAIKALSTVLEEPYEKIMAQLSEANCLSVTYDVHGDIMKYGSLKKKMKQVKNVKSFGTFMWAIYHVIRTFYKDKFSRIYDFNRRNIGRLHKGRHLIEFDNHMSCVVDNVIYDGCNVEELNLPIDIITFK